MWASLLHFIVPGLVPVAAHVVTRITDHLTGGAEPQNVGETVQLMDAQTRQAQALAALDAPGANCSRWVNDLRASARYILGFAVIGWAIYVQAAGTATLDMMQTASDAMTAVFSFFFMDRVVFHLTRRS